MVVCKGLVGGLAGLSLWAMAGAANAGLSVAAVTVAPPEAAARIIGLAPDADVAMFRLYWRNRDSTWGTDAPRLEMALYLFDPAAGADPENGIWSGFYFHSLDAGNYYVPVGNYAQPPLSAHGELLPFLLETGR